MKKTLSLVCAFILSIAAYAQTDVTKFLGIPVDGSKTAMIEKLKAKGFTHERVSGEDVLTGEFNGSEVNIFVVTNNNKVCRIMVCDAHPMDEGSIRIRFNTLCEQFRRNKKYFSLDDYTIPEDENIGIEMITHNKKYDAVFYQAPEITDSTAIANQLKEKLLRKYTQEQLAAPTEEIKAEIIKASSELAFDLMSKKSVWFRIMNDGLRYYISMFYDNEYNRAQGEDL